MVKKDQTKLRACIVGVDLKTAIFSPLWPSLSPEIAHLQISEE